MFKTCTKCHKPQPIHQFNIHKNTRDGLTNWCKQCISDYNKDRRRIIQLSRSPRSICSICNKTKLSREFATGRLYCKTCAAEKAREQRQKRYSQNSNFQPRGPSQAPTNIKPNYKWCPSCKQVLETNTFYKQKSGYYSSECKRCGIDRNLQTNRTKKIRALIYKGGKCQFTGCKSQWDDDEDHFSNYQFHHRDPSCKIANWPTFSYWSWEKQKKELDKCELLCTKHHKIIHARFLNNGEPNPDYFALKLEQQEGKQQT